MSAVSDYIHYQYNNYTGYDSPAANASYLAKVFNHSRVQQQYKQSLKTLKTQLNNIFRNKIKINGNTLGEEEFFKLLDDLQHNVIEKAASEMSNQLETTNLGRGDISDALADINKLQAVIHRFSTIIEQMVGNTFSDNPIPVLTLDMLQGKPSVDKIKEVYRKAYLDNKTTFKVDDSYSRAIVSHQNEINKIMANLSALKAISNGGMSQFSSSIQSESISAFLYSTFFTINRIIGFVSEDVLEKSIPNYLLKEMKQLDENVKILASAEGTGSSSIWKTKTEDISLSLDGSKMLEDNDTGKITIKLPGVTLKRTNVKNGGVAKVHVKTDAILSNFLDNANFSVPLQEFYQAYADYNMAIIRTDRKQKEAAQLNKSASAAMANMYNYFHAAILPLALAGSLEKDDFAWFMVINDKVYNVAEILEKIADEQDSSFVSSDLPQHQTAIKNAHNSYYQQEVDPASNIEGQHRSAMILNTIRNSKITMELNVNLNSVA